jgi:hypothetical protein
VGIEILRRLVKNMITKAHKMWLQKGWDKNNMNEGKWKNLLIQEIQTEIQMESYQYHSNRKGNNANPTQPP